MQNLFDASFIKYMHAKCMWAKCTKAKCMHGLCARLPKTDPVIDQNPPGGLGSLGLGTLDIVDI